MFEIDPISSEPIYKQLSNRILLALDRGELSPGDKLPSLNQLRTELQLGKETIISAFASLKELGLVESIQGKGYFITNKEITDIKHNIFLLFDNFAAYKQELYQSIVYSLGKNGIVDIYFHHYNMEVFNSLIKMSKGKYTEYVIMPPGDMSGLTMLEKLPENKTYILDLGLKNWGNKFASICQDFENDVITALSSVKERLVKYREFILVFDETDTHPYEIPIGFIKFCQINNFSFKIIPTVSEEIKTGQCFIVIDDKLLVDLIEKVAENGLQIGSDIGVISYNETPLKKIAANGITTLSTDFKAMGNTLIQMVLEKQTAHLINPSRIILRNSL